MLKAMTFFATLTVFSIANADVNVCKVQELSYVGSGTRVVTSHALEILTLDKVALDLGFSGKRVELQRTVVESGGEFVSVSVKDSASGEILASGRMDGDLRIGESFGRSVSVSCSNVTMK